MALEVQDEYLELYNYYFGGAANYLNLDSNPRREFRRWIGRGRRS